MPLSPHDIYIGLIAIAAIAVALFCTSFAIKNNWLTKLWGRKLLHFTAISTCAFAINYFENRILLGYIFIVFFFILLVVIQKGWMQVNDYKTYGIALFPLAFAVLLFIPLFSKSIIVYSTLVLAISDAIAGICGEYFGKQKIVFLFEKKSLAGLIAFYFSTLFISLFYFNHFSFDSLLFCVALTLLPAITELFSYRGSDNFTVPILTATWALLIINLNPAQIQTFLLLAFLFAALSFFACYKKWLTLSGATAAFWVALVLYVTGNYKAFIAPGIFLISGSLLSKLNKIQKEKEGRNAVQVFANGIIGIVFMIAFAITHQSIYLITAVVSFCISMADSTSSEMGVYFKGHTFDILSLKKIPPGLSGGISIQGTIAGFVGAALLAFAASYCYNFSASIFIWITIAGFTGMIADSILGSWLQIKYKTTKGNLSDDAEIGALKAKGLSWCTNDTVNILSNILISLLFFYIYRHFI